MTNPNTLLKLAQAQDRLSQILVDAYNKGLEQGKNNGDQGIGGDVFGHFVTAKLKGKDDCRQGIVISINPLIIRGKLGDYMCEGTPTIVDG